MGESKGVTHTSRHTHARQLRAYCVLLRTYLDAWEVERRRLGTAHRSEALGAARHPCDAHVEAPRRRLAALQSERGEQCDQHGALAEAEHCVVHRAARRGLLEGLARVSVKG